MNKDKLLAFFQQTNYRIYLGLYLVYALVLFTLKLVNRGFRPTLNLAHLMMLTGGLIGLGIGLADRIVYVYFSRPNEEFSLQVKGLIQQKQYRLALNFLTQDTDRSRKLATNNILFLGVWVVLALFVITSTFNGFSRGLILGIGLVLAYDLFVDFKDKLALKKRLFWPIAREMTDQELNASVFFFWIALGLLSLLAI